MVLVHRLGWDPHMLARNPWLWPLSRAAAALSHLQDWPRHADLDALYRKLAGQLVPAEPLCFTANVRKQDRRRDGYIVPEALYDGRISLRREVPTRERDWHDLFNAMCFATFPRAKRALHTRQFEVMRNRLGERALALPPARTREQDSLTLFDEGGVVIAASRRACEALGECETEELADVLTQLECAGSARTVPFGHALFEHLVEGLAAPGGGSRLLVIDPLPESRDALLDAVDRALAAELCNPARFQSPHEHLYLRFNRIRLVPAPR